MKSLNWYAVIENGKLWCYRRILVDGTYQQFSPDQKTMKAYFYQDKMRYYSSISRA